MPNDICLQCLQNPKGKNHTFCSGQCSSLASAEAPNLIKIPTDHVMFENVVSRFKSGWKGQPLPSISGIYLITWERLARLRFEDYRSEVEMRGKFKLKGLSPGDEKKRFRGVARYCTLGEAGNTTLCYHPDCKLCESIRDGFGPYLDLKRATG
ncbi:hypothetical protein FQN54_003684 [Arachnomyces sp. PD_36]|nr:hypothetical protein FQN54_003684 [Arachnomyces sp. PD_36]